jgi:hypothetical protein
VPYRTHFRVTNLPQPAVLRQVFARIEELLCAYARVPLPQETDRSNVVDAQARFK